MFAPLSGVKKGNKKYLNSNQIAIEDVWEQWVDGELKRHSGCVLEIIDSESKFRCEIIYRE